MEIIRFYANDPGVELLAKYSVSDDRGLEAIKTLCAPVMTGLNNTPDPYDILNMRILELDARLADSGFQRMPLLGADEDMKCSRAYDVLFNPGKFVTTYVIWKVNLTNDPDMPYEKILEGKHEIGAILN